MRLLNLQLESADQSKHFYMSSFLISDAAVAEMILVDNLLFPLRLFRAIFQFSAAELFRKAQCNTIALFVTMYFAYCGRQIGNALM